jgi:hypothetical protein
MRSLKGLFLSVFFLTFFIGCGGSGGSNGNSLSTTISGKVVDNYIQNATVCIDSNKNNTCDTGELTTTSSSDGSFSFSNDAINSNDIIIAYGGTDATTGETFNYIVKNTVANKDSNSKVILSSINTLIVDYMDVASKNLNDATTAVVNFLGAGTSNIESANAIADVVANRISQDDEFEKSLKLFQIIAAINDVNDSINSAKSFNDLAKYIRDNNTKTDDDNISLTNYNANPKTIYANQYTPVILEDNTWNFYVDMSPTNEYNFNAYDPSGRTLTYSLSGTDQDDFNVSSNGKIQFLVSPTTTNYINPTDNDFDGEYRVDVNISNGDTFIIKELIVNVIKYNKSVKAILDTVTLNVEDNATVGTILGSISVTNSESLDSEIIKYELNPSDSNFDINRTSGNIYIKDRTSFPNPTSGNTIERNVSVRAKNSAGWSSIYISTINIVNAGELNTTATISNETFETIYENNSSTQIVGTVTIAQDGGSGNVVDDYNITSGNDSGYFAINSSGEINVTNSFDYESQDTYTIGVKAHNANGWGSEASITIKIKDVNEAPTMTPAVETKTVSLGEFIERTYSLNDGDTASGVTQTISINVSSSNGNVTVNKSISSGVDGNNLVLTLTGNTVGTSLITVVLNDNNGTDNGGIEETIYEFNTTVRSNGWKIYDNRKQANNNSVHSVPFDDRTYTWNPTKQWYEDTTNDTILMPVEIIKSIKNAYLAGNFNEVAEGHYYVNKSEYLWDVNKSQIHTAITKYKNANNVDNNITANNDNFQHDAYHNFFVSMISKTDVNTDKEEYYGDWVDGNSSNTNDYNWTIANDVNNTYGTAENYSQYYIDNSDVDDTNYNIYIDANNTSHSTISECAKMYGKGWRIPTAYEMGIGTDEKSDIDPILGSNDKYIPAYTGHDTNGDIFSSTRFGAENQVVVMEIQDNSGDGLWKYRNLNDKSRIRCIYKP